MLKKDLKFAIPIFLCMLCLSVLIFKVIMEDQNAGVYLAKTTNKTYFHVSRACHAIAGLADNQVRKTSIAEAKRSGASECLVCKAD